MILSDIERCVGRLHTPGQEWFNPLQLVLADVCEGCARRSKAAGVYIAPEAEQVGGDWHCVNRRSSAVSVCVTEPDRQTTELGGVVCAAPHRQP